MVVENAKELFYLWIMYTIFQNVCLEGIYGCWPQFIAKRKTPYFLKKSQHFLPFTSNINCQIVVGDSGWLSWSLVQVKRVQLVRCWIISAFYLRSAAFSFFLYFQVKIPAIWPINMAFYMYFFLLSHFLFLMLQFDHISRS